MHGHTPSSEEICDEYAAQTMFSQSPSQAFPTEKKPDFVSISGPLTSCAVWT